MVQCRKVMVLYVGGTIGMQRNDKGVFVPVPNTFFQKVKKNSELHDSALASEYFRELKENELVLPPSYGLDAIVYRIVEYTPLLDSSNMTCKDWIRIARDIQISYNVFDGFIVLHGTDTLAYTSSALSFMLDGLQKPVILTGSQIPIFESRGDAKDNFLTSLIISGYYDIPEVCVFFANRLFRGNRIVKMSSNELDAFSSPNYHTLADIGVDVRAGVKCPIRGIVIQSYGTGNIPSRRSDLLSVFRRAIENEILIVNVTQCSRGTVCASYETGKAFEEIGIISGEDMTAEAALTKLTYVLALPGLTFHQRVQIMKTDLRGEMTVTFRD